MNEALLKLHTALNELEPCYLGRALTAPLLDAMAFDVHRICRERVEAGEIPGYEIEINGVNASYRVEIWPDAALKGNGIQVKVRVLDQLIEKQFGQPGFVVVEEAEPAEAVEAVEEEPRKVSFDWHPQDSE